GAVTSVTIRGPAAEGTANRGGRPTTEGVRVPTASVTRIGPIVVTGILDDSVACGTLLPRRAGVRAVSSFNQLPRASPLKNQRSTESGEDRDVAILLARGLTNRQIAGKLVFSPATVRVHVEHILEKLGLHSRTQLIAWLAG